MESEIQEKTNHTELLMQLYLDIKELKDDWTEIVEEGIDIDNIMRTYKFYVKYIEKIDNGDLSFDDYVLFYIQDRSEYAAKCLLEKIWEEMNILLEIYDSNRKIFNKYDCKGLSNSIIQVPCYFNYNDILLCCKPNNWLSFLHCLTIFVPFLPYFALIQARNPLQTRFPRIWKLHKQQEAGSNFY